MVTIKSERYNKFFINWFLIVQKDLVLPYSLTKPSVSSSSLSGFHLTHADYFSIICEYDIIF